MLKQMMCLQEMLMTIVVRYGELEQVKEYPSQMLMGDMVEWMARAHEMVIPRGHPVEI